MLSQSNYLGFYKNPVTKGLLTSVAFLSTSLIVMGPRYQQFFAYTTESLTENLEMWRLLTSKLAFLDPRNLLLGLVLMYNFRLFEKRYGSTKFASYLFANGVMTTFLELAALFVFQSFQQGNIPLHWSQGPTGVVASFFVPFFLDVPYISAPNVLGHILNGKWLVYILGLQLLSQSTQSSIAVGCGLLSSLLYRLNFLHLRSWLRIPTPLTRLSAALLGPLLRSPPPREGPVPMGATLEIQRQQRMELMEQRMLLAQARQFRQQQALVRGVTPSTRPTISAPFAGRTAGNLASVFRQRHSRNSNSGDTPDTEPGSAPHSSQTQTSRDTSSVPEEQVQQLTDMGFNRRAVVQALLATHNNVSMATNLLLQDG
ncbi:ubiquitin-associated domain-containing protein 2-like [Acanthaster planci]|uniref:Ubiquitin-associated domain-containing protein 2-like n=1 Tax=Acanthaster planci TaxID=133434 RepID=A0A8B7YVC7_ACAPL|nr:ubiquitin-associated domain-containing protein 2-like [Acanthaster planci]